MSTAEIHIALLDLADLAKAAAFPEAAREAVWQSARRWLAGDRCPHCNQPLPSDIDRGRVLQIARTEEAALAER